MKILRCGALASLLWFGGPSSAEAQCAYTLTPTAFTVGATATSRTLSIITGTQCSWTAISAVSWIAVSDGAAGKGIGSVTFTVEQNPTGAPRSGTLAVAGQTVSVTQDANGCTYALTPTSFGVDATASSRTISVVSGSACAWSAAAAVQWIIVTSGAGGTGIGSVSFSIAANDGATRTGVLTIGGQSVTIVQGSIAASAVPPAPANLHVVR
jgi:hypothetical protein